jgi:cytochrome c5
MADIKRTPDDRRASENTTDSDQGKLSASSLCQVCPATTYPSATVQSNKALWQMAV